MSLSISETQEIFKNGPFDNMEIAFDQSFVDLTTMKVGGTAGVLAYPKNALEVCLLVSCCKKQGIPFYILGGGSNLVFADQVYNGVVICTKRLDSFEIIPTGPVTSWHDPEFEDMDQAVPVRIVTGSGMMVDDMLEKSARKGCWTLDTFYGLPGTAGGMCYMNARCYGKDTGDFVRGVEYIDLDEIPEDCTQSKAWSLVRMYRAGDSRLDKFWEYKKSPWTGRNCLILSVEFAGWALKPELLDSSEELCQDDSLYSVMMKKHGHYYDDRMDKGHFRAPSAGSVFKNNHDFGNPTGVIIDQAGLKGLREGGAQVAPWHGNFIINDENATGDDVYNLVRKVQSIIREKTGFDIESEIILVGF